MFHRFYLTIILLLLCPLTLASTSGFFVHFHKPNDWNDAYIYIWNQNGAPRGAWPGERLTKAASGFFTTFISENEFDSDGKVRLVFSNGGDLKTNDLIRDKEGWFLDGAWLDQAPQSGEELYQEKCASCHGANGSGGVGPSLLSQDRQCPSCTSSLLPDRIHRTMPLGDIDSCTGTQPQQCAYEVAQYILTELNEATPSACKSEELMPRRIRLLTQWEYENTIQDLFRLPEVYRVDAWPEVAKINGFDNNSDQGVVSQRHMEAFVKTATQMAQTFTLQDLAGRSCENSSQLQCLITNFATRAFRRPLTEMELQSYQSLRAHVGDGAVIQAILLSPYFLYRKELGQFADSQRFKLTSYEIASLLSYTLWQTMPDEELFELARKGQLKSPEVLKEQAKRLLHHQKARETMRRFVIQWTGVEGILDMTKSDPEFNDRIRAAALYELQAVFEDITFSGEKSFSQLFNTPFTIVNRELANFYQLPYPQDGQGFVQVPLQGDRAGILGHAAILASYSPFNESSPIKRGVFIRRKILCHNLPEPPPGVDVVVPKPKPGETIRDRLRRHQDSGNQPNGQNSCASCHQYIDGIGFGFERFDQVGKYREIYADSGVDIDASGNINFLEGLNRPSDHEFSNLPELGDILAQAESPKRCFVKQFYRYFKGEDDRPRDQCDLLRLEQEFEASDYKVRTLLHAITGLTNFSVRK